MPRPGKWRALPSQSPGHRVLVLLSPSWHTWLLASRDALQWLPSWAKIGWAAVCMELTQERGGTPDQSVQRERRPGGDNRSGGKAPPSSLSIERLSGHRGDGRAPGVWGRCVGCRRDRQTVSPETGCPYPVSPGLPGSPSRPALTPTPPLHWIHTHLVSTLKVMR